MEERWKDVVGYEGLYRVSSTGRVRSKARMTFRTVTGVCPCCKKTVQVRQEIRAPGKMLKTRGHKGSPPMAFLYRKGAGKSIGYMVSRLVLEAFVGPCPRGKECCHEDGDHTNNNLGNLRWDTHKSNMADRERHGRHDRGSRSVKAKLTEEDIPAIRALKSDEWGAMSKAARKYGVDVATIRDIWVGRTWRHVK